MFKHFFYDFILYNRQVKKLAAFILKQPLLVKSPPYQHFYQKLIAQKRKTFDKKPFRVMIENTNICNADCVFCPHKIMRRKTGIMPLSLSRKITDQCADLGIDYFTIYGFGEPFLDGLFFKRVRYAKKKGLGRVTTNTNAAFMDREKAKKVIDSGLDEIYISFDAATRPTYQKIRPGLNFATVEKNISNLIKLKKKKESQSPKIFLSFVESDLNRHEVSAYLKKWQDKVDGISISLVHNWTGKVDFGQETSGLRDPCRLLWTDMVVSFDGRVPLCCNDYENRLILGDIKKQTIEEVWGGKNLKKVRKLHLAGRFKKIPLCKACQYNYHFKSPWWVGK
jgi:radical SAM protein with 4Fe4S-binding SPASM domain